jgi:phage tail-like protein
MKAKASDAVPICRFYVQIEGMSQAVFTEASGLAMEMTVEDVEEGGNNDFVHKMPGRCKVGNLTLKRGMATSNEFLIWSRDIAHGKMNTRNVSVVLYNVDGTQFMRWEFKNAFPVKWSGPQFKADDKASAIETLELAHDGFDVS